MDILKIQPVIDSPALFIEDKKILVFADLHIGIESELRGKGLNASSQTGILIKKIQDLCEKYKPLDIVLLGDVKHNIPTSTISERKDIKNFLEEVKNIAIVHIIPGNHDGFIHKLTPNGVIIHPSDGMVIENVGFIHGHRWPNEAVMRCDQVIMAHTHPTVMLTDRLEHRSFEPCWIKTQFLKDRTRKKYSNFTKSEVLIMPAFNPLCGGIAVNREGIQGPMGKIIDIKNAEIYLIDGTLLGRVKDF